MSLLSIFTQKAPNLGGLEFDAELENITSKSITLTEYPVEFGANVNDHRIINPNRYIMTGAISNTPLGFGLDDIGLIGAGLIGGAVGGVAGGLIGGVAAYLLAGDESTRAAAAISALNELMITTERFSVDNGLEVLDDMVLIRLDYRRNPENEDGLIFIAELRQLNTVYTRLVQTGIQSRDQLPTLDPAENQAAPSTSRGSVNTELVA